MQVRTRAQLIEALGGVPQLRTALARGAWQRVLHGVYAEGRGPTGLDVQAEAVRLVLPARALVADRCLLWLLGVDVLPPGPPVLEVVVPRGAVVPRRRGVRAREAEVLRPDRGMLGALPVLRPVRAVADLLRLLPLSEAVVVADAVQHAGLVTAHGLAGELSHHAGLRGVRLAHRALELSDGRAESPPESRVRLVLTLAGLPCVPQHVVCDAAGRFVARVDLAFPEARLAIEYDGREAHGDAAFVADRQRQNALLAAGWRVLRYTAEDVRLRPHVVVADVRRALQPAA